ncbi:hypothetical protein [Enterobacter ludwigii]|uniref:hypothetical protein n=1 Tax=Enterobacter ludwigii TaxID=299767 RepID=UPI00186612FE|nr:hypothetical protein [Enterobacter ludwigii]
MDQGLTPMEFNGIRQNLESISDTWADLWTGDSVILPACGTFPAKRLTLSPTSRVIIGQRRSRYPNDIFLFQSHSLRVKVTARPVTVIAFNMALKKAAQGITHKTVSSKSALHVSLVRWNTAE